MRKKRLTSIVSSIVIGGHFVIFTVIILLSSLGVLRGNDAFQSVLMVSPVLSVTSFEAFTWIMESDTSDDWEAVRGTYAFICLFFPSALIVAVLMLFGGMYWQITGFGPDQLKNSLGVIEAFFGLFIGYISKSLYARRIIAP